MTKQHPPDEQTAPEQQQKQHRHKVLREGPNTKRPMPARLTLAASLGTLLVMLVWDDAIRTVDSDFTVKGAYAACSELLESRAATAIVAGNDLTAIGVLHRAYDAGLRVPEHLSVVGFDDILFAEYTQPALTTVAVGRTEVGKKAFEALWTMMADTELAGREFRVGTRLITRQSAGPPAS